MPYPLYRIVSGGKVIAERAMETYGMTHLEWISTTLTSLPENFECTLYVGMHAKNSNPIYVLKYPAVKK